MPATGAFLVDTLTLREPPLSSTVCALWGGSAENKERCQHPGPASTRIMPDLGHLKDSWQARTLNVALKLGSVPNV